MNRYIHSHLNYDQIIVDESEKQQEKRAEQTIVKPIGKPFWIQSSKHSNYSGSNKFTITQNTTEISKANQQHSQIRNSNNSSLMQQYLQDFQSYSEQTQQQSLLCQQILNQSIIGKNKYQILRNSNYSAILPQIRKESLSNKGKQGERISQFRKPQNNLTKSTIELRQLNKKLVRDIQIFRNLMPNYKKNKGIIDNQQRQITKMKQQKIKSFDITYQLDLDKSLQTKLQQTNEAKQRIKQNQSKIKYKVGRFKNMKLCKLRIKTENPQQLQTSQYSMIREELLAKRKQQQNNNKKLIQLNTKIIQYQNIIQQLQERAKLGQYEKLKNRKIILQYDIMMAKTKVQQKECQIMVENTKLNNLISQMSLEITKCSNQIQKQQQQKFKEKQQQKEKQEAKVEWQDCKVEGRSSRRLVKFKTSRK